VSIHPLLFLSACSCIFADAVLFEKKFIHLTIKGEITMKARIPKHREFIINFPDSVEQSKANEGWDKLMQIVEDYKKAHNGASVYAPTFIEDCEPAVKKLQEEYGFEYTVEFVQ
jgi:hypothetical protein